MSLPYLHLIPVGLTDRAGLRADHADQLLLAVAGESAQLRHIGDADIGHGAGGVVLEGVDIEDHGIGFFLEEAITGFAFDIARPAAGAQPLARQLRIGAFDDHGRRRGAAVIRHADLARLMLEVDIALLDDTMRQLLVV